MKNLLAIFLLLFFTNTQAGDPYHNYLLSKIESQQVIKLQPINNATSRLATCVVPHFERPKGAVFCRMEDYLTAKTKIWIKVGVK